MPPLHRNVSKDAQDARRGACPGRSAARAQVLGLIPLEAARGALQTPISGLPEIGAKCAQVG